MMKSTKKLLMMLTTMLLFAGVLIGSCLVASAADATYPKKVRVYPKDAYSSLTVDLTENTDEIKNVKSSNKNLKVVLTHKSVYRSSGDESRTNNYQFVLYGKKTGKYTVKFDVVSADGATKSSHEITVFVKDDPAVKSATFGGKDMHSITGTSGKVKVVMNKGYKLKKIRVGKYKRIQNPDENTKVNTEIVYTEIKNNSKITLSKVPSEREYEYSYASEYSDYSTYSYSWNKDVTAPTYIEVTYIDKWTKLETTTTYYLTRVLI